MDETAEHPRVLCVDDDARVLGFIVRTLSGEFDVVGVGSGALGLEQLRDAGPFAVVISDLSMPGMSGATFLAEVRHRAPNTANIMLTGCIQVVGSAEAVRTGQVFQFLTKPCTGDELLSTVRAAAEFHRERLGRAA